MECIEFQNLEDFAVYLGYEYPEEIYIVAYHEGFYEVDGQDDKQLSKDGINDYLKRTGADIKVISTQPFIYCEKE